MNNIFKYLLVLSVAAVSAVSLSAQGVRKTDYSDKEISAIKINKDRTDNHDGTYTLTLDAFVTGEMSNMTVVETKDAELDVVLVLDLSSSMTHTLQTIDEYTEKSVSTIGDTRNLYIFFGSDYYQVTRSGSNKNYTYSFKDGANRTQTLSTDSSSALYWKNFKYYSKTSTTLKRIDALKSACQTFLDIVYEDAVKKRLDHKISIVSFWNSATTNLTLANGDVRTKYSDIKSLISNLSTYTGTRQDLGMQEALPQLAAASADATKAVVMFTDGEPYKNNQRSYLVMVDAVDAAYTMKNDYAAKVYTIGMFETSYQVVNDFMDYTSSNFPTVKIKSNSPEGTSPSRASLSPVSGGTRDSDKYFFLANSLEELNNVFGKIAVETTVAAGTGSNIMLETSEVTVRDVITPQFCIPEDGSISLYVAEVKNITYDSNGAITGYEWYDKEPAPATVEVVDSGTESKNVDIKGFNFSEHWVGYETKYTKNPDGTQVEGKVSDRKIYKTADHIGQKLIIEILVAPDPDSDGGYATTNGDKSGFYIGDVQAGDPTVPFDVPGSVYTPMDLKIIKKGIEDGETALFKVYTGTGDSKKYLMTVALTAGENGEVNQTIAKLPIVDDDDNPITYTVEEDTVWRYNYNSSPVGSVSKPLYKWEGEGDSKTFVVTNEFVFNATVNEYNGARHDENAENNSFPNRARKTK